MERQSIVAKFGGTSMATAELIANVAEIVRSDPNRRYVIVSAPGSRFKGDLKITDLLKTSADLQAKGGNHKPPLENALSRFEEIGSGLGINVGNLLKEVSANFATHPGPDWLPSRGEWLTAKIMAAYLRWPFVDAAKLLKISADGSIDPSTYNIIEKQFRQSSSRHVIPGFYGRSTSTGDIKTLARGGSDLTGSIVAREVKASLYENWTDVNGLLAVDDQVVTSPKSVREITYWEMRELGNNGVPVLQRNTVQPVFQAGIPINILNTFQPDHEGTMVQSRRNSLPEEEVIAIASRSGYLSVQIRKFGINEQPGYIGVIANALAERKVSIEHIPTGADMITLIIDQSQIQGDAQSMVDTIIQAASPDEIKVQHDLGLICLVGQQATKRLSRVLYEASRTLQRAGILIESVSAAQGGNSILLGVNSRQTAQAVEALYKAFISEQ